MHSHVVRQFIDFKSRNDEISNERNSLLQNWRTTEMGIVHMSPVVEASHGFDINTPLQLFNCLIPQTKRHRRLIVPKEKETVITDYEAR